MRMRPQATRLSGRVIRSVAELPDQADQRLPVVIVPAAVVLEISDDARRIFIRPVRQHDHVIAVVFEGVALPRLHDEGGVHPELFLLAGRMSMEPICTRLPDLEAIGERFAGLDAVAVARRNARYAIHFGRYDQSVPMDRDILIKSVADIDDRIFAFTESQHGPR
jgi:hypothetical protein